MAKSILIGNFALLWKVFFSHFQGYQIFSVINVNRNSTMFLTFNQIFDKKYFCIFLRFNTKNSNFKNCVNTKNSNFNLRFTWAIFDTFNLKEDILDRPPNKTDCVGCIDQIFSQSNTLEYDIFFRWLLKRADVALSNFSAAFSSRNLKVFFFFNVR